MNQKPLQINRKEKLEHAHNLLALGAKAIEQDNAGEALLFYQEAFFIRAAILGPEAPQTGEVAQALGQELCRHGTEISATEFFEKSVEQYQNTRSPALLHLGYLLERLGNACFGMDDLTGAQE